MSPETKAKLEKLRSLSLAAGTNIYERVQLAAAVLSSDDFIIEFHKGDEFKARDYVSEQYFADIGGFLHVTELVKIYDLFPDVSVWEKNRYNLRVMHDLLQEHRRSQKRVDEASKLAANKPVTSTVAANAVDSQSSEDGKTVRFDPPITSPSETIKLTPGQQELQAVQQVVSTQADRISQQEMVIADLRNMITDLQNQNARLRHENARLLSCSQQGAFV